MPPVDTANRNHDELCWKEWIFRMVGQLLSADDVGHNAEFIECDRVSDDECQQESQPVEVPLVGQSRAESQNMFAPI